MHFRAACLSLAALPLLSGCVAAALPVIAAGGVINTQSDGDGQDKAERGPPRVSIDLTPPPSTVPAPATLVQNYTLADGTRMEVMAGPLPAPDGGVAVPAPASAVTTTNSASAFPVTHTLDDGTQVQIVPGALPPPGGAGMAPPNVASYEDFYGYALAQGTLPVAGSDRRSALLADPAALAPATRTCSIHPAAVLIDLDPGAGVFDPEAARTADPRLVGTLAALRAQEIRIGWITSATADRAGAIRRALIGSGLDPIGRDELALLRYPEERKQSRREDFAKEFCVVAIAGDDRVDFDELFEYLKDRSLAASLDGLVGKGWFLIPQPLN